MTNKYLAEEQMRHEDLLDNRLYEALEVMEMPTKWGMNREGDFTELFPCPVFKDGRVSGIEYRTTKAVELPEELLERLCLLEDEIEGVVTQPTNSPNKFTPEDAVKMLELREQGVTYREIGEMINVSINTVKNYVKKHKKNNNKVAKRGRPVKYPEAMIKEWVQLKDSGMVCREIAEKYNTTTGMVQSRISQYRKQAKETV
ncbi:helix-turn-helix domain-containing protein [Priestia aryabhattai]|uniref:helix-turn-helix domain-containing protein n=1 Tax=Priestia aryabhattai TaxID=412384 RepID=UPI0015F4C962|nr:sigma factor-like helix-turn-helix DNA-binding protein [Priestia aryabhattai]